MSFCITHSVYLKFEFPRAQAANHDENPFANIDVSSLEAFFNGASGTVARQSSWYDMNENPGFWSAQPRFLSESHATNEAYYQDLKRQRPPSDEMPQHLMRRVAGRYVTNAEARQLNPEDE